MSPLETEFNDACNDCVKRGDRHQLAPAETIANLYALLFEYEMKARNAGWGDEWAIDVHRYMAAMLSETIPLVAIGNQPISEAEVAILEFSCGKSAKSHSKSDLVAGIGSRFHSAFPGAIRSLYRRGLIKDGSLDESICLTAAGECCAAAWLEGIGDK